MTAIEITDMLRPGHATLPNRPGLAYPDAAGHAVVLWALSLAS